MNLIPVSGVELFLWWLILMGGRRILLLLLLRHHHLSLSLSLLSHNKGVLINVFWKESLKARCKSLSFLKTTTYWGRTLLRREKTVTRGLCNYKIFALGTLNQGQKGSEKKMWRNSRPSRFTYFFEKTHTSHNTRSLFYYFRKMFSVTQTVTQSVRLNATVSKRDVTRRYYYYKFCVCWSIDRERAFCFYLLFSLHVIFSIKKRMLSKRARDEERHLHSSQHHSPWKLLLFPPLLEKRDNKSKA